MLVIKPDLNSVVNAQGAIILDTEADELTTLNSTGGYIWARLREGMTVEAIIRDLIRETGEDPVAITTDVCEFVEQLAEKHLIRR